MTSRLNNWALGRTLRYDDISRLISDSSVSDSQCRFRLTPPNSDNFFRNKFLIGQLLRISQIISIQMSFHYDNDDMIRDDDGNPIIYRSSRLEFGHAFLDTLQQDFSFAYVRCLLQLEPNCDFDLRSLFFHFGGLSSTEGRIQREIFKKTTFYHLAAVITGPTSVSLDSPNQIYNISTPCPVGATCVWSLDGNEIAVSDGTAVTLAFLKKHIGNRTLTYTAKANGNSQVLASLPISVSDNIKYGKSLLILST